MTTLEELAAALYGESAQTDIKAENPYYSYSSIPVKLGSSAMDAYSKDPSSIRVGEALGYNALGSFLSGMLQGAGDDYQQTLTNRYTDTVLKKMLGQSTEGSDLPSGLFGKAENTAKLFQMKRGLEQADLLQKAELEKKGKEEQNRAALRQALLVKGIEDPDVMERIRENPELSKLVGIESTPIATKVNTPADTGEPAQVIGSGGEASSELMKALGIKSLTERRGELYDYYRNVKKYTPTKAADAANKDLEGEAASNRASFGDLKELEPKAEEMTKYAAIANSALDQGLRTGFGAETQLLVNKIPLVGDKKKAQLAEDLQSVESKNILMNRMPGVGGMSDPEMKVYIRGGVGLGKEVESNREIANRLNLIGQRSKDYIAFVRAVQEGNGTAAQADRAWAKYMADEPIWVKDKSGDLVTNTKAKTAREYFIGSSLSDSGLGKGASKTDTPKLGGQRYKASDLIAAGYEKTAQGWVKK
jgi:hypothetical protein